MKKTSTQPSDEIGITRESRRAISPRQSTVTFLRQFARAYRPGHAASLPGYVLN